MPDALGELPFVLTIEEAAKALRIGRTAAYSAARTGEIPTVRLGRTLRVPRKALAELLGEHSPSNGNDRVDARPLPNVHGVRAPKDVGTQ